MGRKKRCYSGIGGQAVLEGIMMKNNTRYSIAVRKPDGEIDVEIGEYTGIFGGSGITKIPFIRGIFSFIDSLRLGTRCLNHSASFYEEEEEETAADRFLNKAFKGKAESVLMTLTTIVAVIVAVGLFMVLPYFISDYLKGYVRNDSLLAIIEGAIRILIFVLYVLLISLMKDIRRVYMYHGAEHKCINCIERGRELTVENVMKSSKQHRRCGTSFLLFVMMVSVVLFFFIRVDNMALKVLIRILLIPVIAGIAYEIIRLAGRTDNWLVRAISAPGLWLQGLTTKEPDESMVEVAIKAVEAVFDWRAYLQENFGYYNEEAGEDVKETEKDGVTSTEEDVETVSEEETWGEEAEPGEEIRDEETASEEETWDEEAESEKEMRDEEIASEEETWDEEAETEEEVWDEAAASGDEIVGKTAAVEAAGEERTAAAKKVKSRNTPAKKARNQQRQWTEADLMMEDEDEPSFIGNDEID